jgi:hypothetical protein
MAVHGLEVIREDNKNMGGVYKSGGASTGMWI